MARDPIVPHGSILGPLLFNNDICDLFFIIEDCDIANYVDSNTPYFERFRKCVINLHISTSQIKSSVCGRLIGNDITCKASFENHSKGAFNYYVRT